MMTEPEWETLRTSLVRWFRRNRARAPEDASQETIYRLLKSQVQPEKHVSFAFGIAHNVLHEDSRPLREIPTAWMEIIFVPAEPDSSPITASELDALKQQVLSRTERRIFDVYYSSAGGKAKRRKALADSLGLDPHALTQRIHSYCVRLRNEHARQKESGQS